MEAVRSYSLKAVESTVPVEVDGVVYMARVSDVRVPIALGRLQEALRGVSGESREECAASIPALLREAVDALLGDGASESVVGDRGHDVAFVEAVVGMVVDVYGSDEAKALRARRISAPLANADAE